MACCRSHFSGNYDLLAMSERQVVSIVWRSRGYRVDVFYTEGRPISLPNKKESDAAELAASHGLTLVERHDGTVRWVLRPDSDEPA
jgi:hypothetical protein